MLHQDSYSHKGVEMETLEKLCRYFNVDMSRVVSRLDMPGNTLDLAMEYGLKYRRKPIHYKNKDYNSLGHLCSVLNLDYSLVYHVLYFYESEELISVKFEGYSDLENVFNYIIDFYSDLESGYVEFKEGRLTLKEYEELILPLKTGKYSKREIIGYTYKGVKETSLLRLCNKLNRNINIVHRYRKQGYTLQEAIEKTPIISKILPVTYKGVEYKTLNTLCKEKGVGRSAVTGALKRNMSLEDAIEHALNIKSEVFR